MSVVSLRPYQFKRNEAIQVAGHDARTAREVGEWDTDRTTDRTGKERGTVRKTPHAGRDAGVAIRDFKTYRLEDGHKRLTDERTVVSSV
jgi:hypothetical protein